MIELYNDDCMKVLKTMADHSVDCVITDCPYHIVSGGCRTNDGRNIGGIFTNDECGGMLSHRKKSACNSISNVEAGKLFDHNDKSSPIGYLKYIGFLKMVRIVTS